MAKNKKTRKKSGQNAGVIKEKPVNTDPAIHKAIAPYLKMSSYQRSNQRQFNHQAFIEVFANHLGEINIKDDDGKSILYKLCETFLEWFQQITADNLSEPRFNAMKGISDNIEMLTSMNIDLYTMEKCNGETPCEMLFKIGDSLKRIQADLVEDSTKLGCMPPVLVTAWNEFFRAHNKWAGRVHANLVALSLKYSSAEEQHASNAVIEVLPNGEHQRLEPGSSPGGISIRKLTLKHPSADHLDCFSSESEYADIMTNVKISGGEIRSVENDGVTQLHHFAAKLEVEVEKFTVPWQEIEALQSCEFSVDNKVGRDDRLLVTEMVPYPYDADYVPACLDFLESYIELVKEDQSLADEFSALNFDEACLETFTQLDAAPGEMMQSVTPQKSPKKNARDKTSVINDQVLKPLSENPQTLWSLESFKERQAKLRLTNG